MDLDSLIVKRSAYKQFSADVRGGLGHAYLLVCEDGIVRERLLHLFSVMVFCPTACGACDVCRAIEEGNFPDVRYLDGKKTKVAEISDLIEDAGQNPVVAEKKLILINNFEKLSAISQNKLLKTYEEPPEFLTIIFASASENGILTTIKSRAKKLYFDSLTAKETVSYLVDGGTDRESALMAAAIGNGNLEKAEAMLSSTMFLSLYDECFDLLNNLKSSVSVPEFALADTFSKEKIATALDILDTIFGDIMKYLSGEDFSFLNDGRSFDIKRLASQYTVTSASVALTVLNEGRKLLASNVSSVSVAEYVLFNILEAKHKWQ